MSLALLKRIFSFNFDNNIVWTNYEKKKFRMSDIDDFHLANIISHIKKYLERYGSETLKKFEDEAVKRRLKPEFLEGAQYPHKNKKGQWVKLNNFLRPVIIGRD